MLNYGMVSLRLVANLAILPRRWVCKQMEMKAGDVDNAIVAYIYSINDGVYSLWVVKKENRAQSR
jgi:hypothetical protein